MNIISLATGALAIACLVLWLSRTIVRNVRNDGHTLFGDAPTDSERHWSHRLPKHWRLLWPTLDAMCARSNRDNVHAATACPRHRSLCDLIARAGLPAVVQPGHVVAVRRITLGVAALLSVMASAVGVWVDVMLEGVGGSVSSTQSGAYTAPLFIAGWLLGLLAIAWFLWPDVWLHRRARMRRREIDRQLPFLLDILVLGVQAGLNVQGALAEAVTHGQAGALSEEIARLLSDMRAGQSRSAALKALANRADSPAIYAWVGAMVQADSLGMSIGPLLRAQASAQRDARFERAERLALEAPVKMLFPLVVFIFPCSFIVIAFPLYHSMQGALQ